MLPSNLSQCFQLPTCVSLIFSTLTDYVLSNVPNQPTYTNVLPRSSISDQDSPCACVNFRAKRFQLRYKMIRNENEFDEKSPPKIFMNFPSIQSTTQTTLITKWTYLTNCPPLV